jgi:peptidoglycan hydrolase-like protein with peptidoglycan-binding domain
LAAVKTVSAQFAFVLIALLAIAPFASAKTTSQHKHSSVKKTSSTAHHSTSSAKKTTSRSSHSRRTRRRHVARKSWKSRGQHGISSDRTKQIQEALIRQHYLDGEPTGAWDTKTQEACRKYQADNGWQTKVLPDSRALIKLGLGPDPTDVLNPETAAKSPYLPGGGTEKATDAGTTTVTER